MIEESTHYERLKRSLLNNKLIAFVVLLCAVIVGVASFSEGIFKLSQFIGISGKPSPDLKIVDIDDSEANSVVFKLKNLGNDSAFLTSIEFILERGTKGCDGCPRK